MIKHHTWTGRQKVCLTIISVSLICIALMVPLMGHLSSTYAAKPSKPPAPKPTPTSPLGPVAKIWYFAEGRVGLGFREYLTIDNPDPANACAVDVQYLYTMDGSTTPASKTVTVSIPATSRVTQSVNTDLGIDSSSTSAASLASIVKVSTTTPACTGVVIERPLYFTNYHGLNSSTDVLGATLLGVTYHFADVPTGANNTSYLTILNPGPVSAVVTANYYVGGQRVQTQTVTVNANSRNTISPNAVTMASHVAAVVTATHPVLVERPTYFVNVNGASGAADVIGAQALVKDWLFAEGYANTNSVVGPLSQEYLTIANLDAAKASAPVAITLKSKTGATQTFNVTVNAQSQLIWDVNANNTFTGFTPEVSAEVVSKGGNIVVQREMYFQYSHTVNNQTLQVTGGTDVIGQQGPAARSSYNFAEGYTNKGYNEWLTIQNPTVNAETINATLLNGYGRSSTQTLQVAGNSRLTVDITAVVLQNLVQAGDDHRAYEVSMMVQSTAGAFIAERSMYSNTSGSLFPTQGASDVIGYDGR